MPRSGSEKEAAVAFARAWNRLDCVGEGFGERTALIFPFKTGDGMIFAQKTANIIQSPEAGGKIESVSRITLCTGTPSGT